MSVTARKTCPFHLARLLRQGFATNDDNTILPLPLSTTPLPALEAQVTLQTPEQFRLLIFKGHLQFLSTPLRTILRPTSTHPQHNSHVPLEKCHPATMRVSLDRIKVDVHVEVDGRINQVAEYGEEYDGHNVISCYVPVEEGDKVKIGGKLEGQVCLFIPQCAACGLLISCRQTRWLTMP